MNYQYSSSYLSKPWQFSTYQMEVKVISQKKLKMIKEKWWQLNKLKRTLKPHNDHLSDSGDLQYKQTKEIFSPKKRNEGYKQNFTFFISSPELFLIKIFMAASILPSSKVIFSCQDQWANFNQTWYNAFLCKGLSIFFPNEVPNPLNGKLMF